MTVFYIGLAMTGLALLAVAELIGKATRENSKVEKYSMWIVIASSFYFIGLFTMVLSVIFNLNS